MLNRFGMNRVLEPKYILSTSAWKVDNNREIYPNELRVALRKLHIESTSFKQICLEADDHSEKIRSRIIDIVIRRGKMHNPITDTGGVLCGVVEEIGSAYRNPKGLKPGDKVICNASLAAIPMYISRIGGINRAYSQVEATGYAILFDEFPVVKPPENILIELLLYAYDESGTLYAVSQEAREKQNLLVVGNNRLTNIMYGYAARRASGPNARITCLFDDRSEVFMRGPAVDQLLGEIFNDVHYVNILHPTDCLEQLHVESLYDMSINCADIPGAETINILATRSGGTVFFANLINNYNIALYITEAISRQLHIRCSEGYIEAYDEFDIELVRELAPRLKTAQLVQPKIEDNMDYQPLGRTVKSLEISGYRKSLVEDFVCESRAMTMVLDEILSVARYDCNVLIIGDTGVGKEKIASIIQKNSNRRMHPYVQINCAAIAENLIESELFGYEKGSFTGASPAGKKGYFELADNGTIFLDEVGDLPPDVQAKLLRVIQDGEFYRVGGTQPVKTNVRIISATNRNLEEAVDTKRFRRDLYYRLNVFPIRVPPLTERRSDIPALARYFVDLYGKKFGIRRGITDDAVEYLKKQDWPGNIRELENVVQRLLITAKAETITAFDVMKEIHGYLFAGHDQLSAGEGGSGSEETETIDLVSMTENFEKSIIQYALDKYGSSRKAAKAIGISQTQLIRKKNRYQV